MADMKVLDYLLWTSL